MDLPKGQEAKKENPQELIGPPEPPKEAPRVLAPEKKEAFLKPEESEKGPPAAAAEQPLSSAAAAAVAPAPAMPKDEVTREIEDILSEDLAELFLKMNPEEQATFQAKGEETASAIRRLLNSAKVNLKKILFLVSDWLKMIPGVNKFFLEQEAKIKTDKILAAAADYRRQGKI